MTGTRNRLDEVTLRRLCEVDHVPMLEIATRYGYLTDASGVYHMCRKWNITPYREPRPFDYLRKIDLSPEQHQLTMGTLLGDSYIFSHTEREHPGGRLVMVQGEKQRDYLEWKKRQMEPFIPATNPTCYVQTGFSKGSLRYVYSTVEHPAFVAYRQLFYPYGVKTITQPLLDRLEARALAFWIMDDGSFHPTRKYITICTNAHDVIELDLAAEWFRKLLGIAPYVHSAGRTDQFHLAFNRKAADALRELIRPHFFDRLLYKIGL